MNYLEKLTDLVCTEKQINDDLKELKFGTKLKSGKDIHIITNIEGGGKTDAPFFNTRYVRCTMGLNFQFDKNKIDKTIFYSDGFNKKIKIIGNTLELHHLIWFCENKNIKLSLQTQFLDNFKHTMLFFNRNGCCKYDSKKPLSQQSEEVLKNIFEALAS